MTTAFVAGATGYTGSEVVRLLRGRGARVVAHVRPDSGSLAAWQSRFRALGAEVDSTAWVEDAMAARLAELRPDVVFALLGTTRKRAKAEGQRSAPAAYEAVDYGLTALLCRAAVRAGNEPLLVYLSAVGAGPGARTSYMRARHAAEEAVRSSGLPFVIARPSFISGPGRLDPRPGERIGAAIADGALAVAGALGMRRLQDRYRSTTSTSLARALVGASSDPTCVGRVLEGADLRLG